MKLTVLGSSSKGNCYILQNNNEAIVLEAGLSLSKVKEALNFQINKVSACLITHEHGDHAKYAKNFEKVFPVFTNASVIKAKGLSRSNEMIVRKAFTVGGFKILPFEADHDVECFGFIIKHDDFGNLLFLTDSATCNYEFKNLNHIMIECNYSADILSTNVSKRLLNSFVAKRVRETHMAIDTTKEVLQEHDLSNVYNVVLLHLSDKNSDSQMFKADVSLAIGMFAHIGTPGLELELTNKPY